MKKLALLFAAFIIVGAVSAKVWAGHFTDILPPASATGSVPVSNGYDYNLSTDAGAPPLVSTNPVTLALKTVAQIGSTTPTVIGQLLVLTNSGNINPPLTPQLCVSTSTVAGGWVILSTAAAVTHCQ